MYTVQSLLADTPWNLLCFPLFCPLAFVCVKMTLRVSRRRTRCLPMFAFVEHAQILSNAKITALSLLTSCSFACACDLLLADVPRSVAVPPLCSLCLIPPTGSRVCASSGSPTRCVDCESQLIMQTVTVASQSFCGRHVPYSLGIPYSEPLAHHRSIFAQDFGRPSELYPSSPRQISITLEAICSILRFNQTPTPESAGHGSPPVASVSWEAFCYRIRMLLVLEPGELVIRRLMVILLAA